MLPLIHACFWQMESTFSGPHAWMVMIKWSQQQHRTKQSRQPSMRNFSRALMIRSIPRFLLKFVVQTPSFMREPSNLASTASLQVTSHKLQHARSTMGCLEFPLSVLHRVVGASESSLCLASCCRNFQFFTFMSEQVQRSAKRCVSTIGLRCDWLLRLWESTAILSTSTKTLPWPWLTSTGRVSHRYSWYFKPSGRKLRWFPSRLAI